MNRGMPSLACVTAVFIQLLPFSSADFRGAFSTGPVAQGTFIREASSTLIVPGGNTPLGGDLSLWVGMGTSNGDLVQAICERHSGNGGSPCEDINDDNQWCGYTYTLHGPDQDQLSGPQASVEAGDHFEMRYVFNDDTQQYDQYAVINGNVVSTLSTDSGKAGGFGTAVECAANDCGRVPEHQWINTVITMDVPDPNYNETSGYGGADISGFYTDDGGKNWRVDTITIFESSFH